MSGLIAHATPDKKFYKSNISLAIFAFEHGEATQEDLELLAEFIVILKDKRVSAPVRIKRGIQAKTVIILGKSYTLTKEDLADFEEYKRKREAMKNDKSLELLVSDF